MAEIEGEQAWPLMANNKYTQTYIPGGCGAK